MANCNVCTKAINPKQLKIVCTDCRKEFHGACTKMSKADLDCITAEGLVWRCQPCGATRRKSLRFESAAQEGKMSLEDIMAKIEEIAEGQKAQEQNVNKSYEFLSQKLEENTEEMKKQNLSMEKCLKIIDDLFQENQKLSKRVVELEKSIEDMEQYSRANAIEIHGVPVQPNEDVVSVVKEVGKALDLTVTDSMIDACHRLGKARPNNSSPGIIVKFVRRIDKEEFMRKRRVKRNLSTRHMNMTMDQPVYVNEALTPARRRLLAAARQIRREKNYKFLWVRGGKIFLRRDDGMNVVQVTCQADLDKL